jgi:hypothetical protein
MKDYDRIEIDCECGTTVRVHAQPLTSTVPVSGSKGSVRCPSCQREHEVPGKPLRLFVRQGDIWMTHVDLA